MRESCYGVSLSKEAKHGTISKVDSFCVLIFNVLVL